MQSSAKTNNLVGFIIGVGIAAGFFVTPFGLVNGAQDDEAPITGVTNASEVIRESRFKILDSNGDGYLTRDEVPQSDRTLKSMYTSLDENGDGRLSEPEYVLNGAAS